MISSISEIRYSRRIIEGVKKELIREGYTIDEEIKLGIMVETPAAAILADNLANEVDFFSIGTNDLTQYTLAADRNNDFVSDIFDSFNPAVLRLIKMTSEAAKRHNIPVSVCGELAGHTAATSLLIGMGITHLSVGPPLILELKNRILNLSYENAIRSSEAILNIDTLSKVREMLQEGIVEPVI